MGGGILWAMPPPFTPWAPHCHPLPLIYFFTIVIIKSSDVHFVIALFLVSFLFSLLVTFAHGAMGRLIDPSLGEPIELFLIPASAPRLV